MNHTIKINSILALLLLNVLRITAQDTICFKNQGLLSATILEVDRGQISYTHTSDSSGFIYHADKSRISWIKYRTGLVDSVKGIGKPVIATTMNGPDDIEVLGNRLILHGKGLSDHKLKSLIENCPVPETKAAMLEEYRLMKAYERGQKIYTPIGMACGFGLIPASLLYVVYVPKYDAQETLSIIGGGIIAGTLVGVCSAAVNGICRKNRSEKKKNIAMMYNDIN